MTMLTLSGQKTKITQALPHPFSKLISNFIKPIILFDILNMLWKIRFVKLRQLFFPSGYNLLFNYNQRICLYIIKICISLMCEFEKTAAFIYSHSYKSYSCSYKPHIHVPNHIFIPMILSTSKLYCISWVLYWGISKLPSSFSPTSTYFEGRTINILYFRDKQSLGYM